MRLPEEDCRRRFAAAPVARLATVGAEGEPHLVPVVFALDGDLLYSAVDAKPKSTTNLRRLRDIRARPRVALLADHYEPDWDRLWWVRADGDAAVLDAAADGEGPLRLLARRYAQYRRRPPAGPVIRVAVDRWTGWAARNS